MCFFSPRHENYFVQAPPPIFRPFSVYYTENHSGDGCALECHPCRGCTSPSIACTRESGEVALSILVESRLCVFARAQREIQRMQSKISHTNERTGRRWSSRSLPSQNNDWRDVSASLDVMAGGASAAVACSHGNEGEKFTVFYWEIYLGTHAEIRENVREHRRIRERCGR